MLIDKGFSENDVVSLKIASGEEMVGRFVKETDSSITLNKVLMIAMTQQGPAMAPAMLTVDPESNLTFNKQLVTVAAACYKEIADQYIFQTTGIQPVSAGGIITR